MQIDTLKIKYIKNNSNLRNNDNSIVIVEKNEKPRDFYENPLVSLLIVPLIVLTISTLITKFLNRKRREIEHNKIKEEIKSIKSSFQPIVISTIQKTQDYLLKEKIEVLKKLVEFNAELNKIVLHYNDGEPSMLDSSEFIDELYKNFSEQNVSNYKVNILDKRFFYNELIIDDIVAIHIVLCNILNEKSRLTSTDNIDNAYFALQWFF